MNKKVFKMSFLALMGAILLILMFTPLGYIPVGVLRITTMHIPVILTAWILGVKEGMMMGCLFGISSVVINTINPTITSFVFSPFIEVGGIHGNGYSLLIALVPRILIGLVAGFIYKKYQNKLGLSFAAFLATLTNTILVLGGIYILFGTSYASSRGIAYELLKNVMLTTVFTNGLLEALVAIVVCNIVVPKLKRS